MLRFVKEQQTKRFTSLKHPSSAHTLLFSACLDTKPESGMCSEEVENILNNTVVRTEIVRCSNTKSTVDLQLNGEPAVSAVSSGSQSHLF